MLISATVLLCVTLLCLWASRPAAAGDSAGAPVNYEVCSINELAIDKGVGSLVVHAAAAGGEPEAAQGSATYDITTNGSDMKIVAQLASAMPPGTSFAIRIGAPAGALSSGVKILSPHPAVLATGIGRVAQDSLDITYTFSTAVAAGEIPPADAIVTFTLVE